MTEYRTDECTPPEGSAVGVSHDCAANTKCENTIERLFKYVNMQINNMFLYVYRCTTKNVCLLVLTLKPTVTVYAHRQTGGLMDWQLTVIHIWVSHHIVSQDLRLRLYNAFIVPVLTDNMGTWGLTPTEWAMIDAFHRRQLRQVIGIRYPQRISNNALYRKCA